MNKPIKCLMMLFVATLMLGFTSCGDDDDDVDHAKAIAGNYVGTVSIGGISMPDEIPLTAVRKDNNSATLTIEYDFTVVDKIECLVSITEKNGTYTVAGTTGFQMEGIPIPIPIGVAGTIKSGAINLDIAVGSELGQYSSLVPINVIYSGQKK
ncbi:hypothetical protein LJB91_02225 [Bacteroidales bacterium OttesenSCG-928-L03]|nr:hypothetical protein [Bacteroidales bacterium OttesenSCG-928-L03]